VGQPSQAARELALVFDRRFLHPQSLAAVLRLCGVSEATPAICRPEAVDELA
jgi:hypothetical protein